MSKRTDGARFDILILQDDSIVYQAIFGIFVLNARRYADDNWELSMCYFVKDKSPHEMINLKVSKEDLARDAAGYSDLEIVNFMLQRALAMIEYTLWPAASILWSIPEEYSPELDPETKDEVEAVKALSRRMN